jgi:hypothetical protein
MLLKDILISLIEQIIYNIISVLWNKFKNWFKSKHRSK